MNCFQTCCIIFTPGCSVLVALGGIITLVNYQTDKDWIRARTEKQQIKLDILKTHQQMTRDKYEHDQKMLNA